MKREVCFKLFLVDNTNERATMDEAKLSESTINQIVIKRQLLRIQLKE